MYQNHGVVNTQRDLKKRNTKDTEVLKPKKLYREWQNIRIQPNKLEVSLQQPEKILQETKLDYTLTTYYAENINQGLLFISTTDFYIDPYQIQDWLDIIENKGLLGGGNTQIRATDKHVFYNKQEINSFTTVSIPQLILDLLEEGGPCEEAALKLTKKYH